MQYIINGNNKQIRKIDRYDITSKTFCIQITHTIRDYMEIARNEHAWCLYVMIYNNHPLFKDACNNTKDYDTELGDKLYPDFHCGCTYYNKQLTYVKIGCDYQHLGDESIMYYETDKIPFEILHDAKMLYEYFEQYNPEKQNK